MKSVFNLSDLNWQIGQYVRRIKNRQTSAIDNYQNTFEEYSSPSHFNDLISNINKLDGKNKFNIQSMMNDTTALTPSAYAAQAYEHLSKQDDKNKVVIEIMHKNNRNYDVQA